jgi:hypothetical protein
MRRGRFLKGLSTIVACAALMAAGAHAAGGGKNAVLQEYSTSTTPSVGVGSGTKNRTSKPSGGVQPARIVVPAAHRSTLPFTGVDLALMATGGTMLLLLGLGLRRFARNKA